MLRIELLAVFSRHVRLPVAGCGEVFLTVETFVRFQLEVNRVDVPPNLRVCVTPAETFTAVSAAHFAHCESNVEDYIP